MTDRLLRVLSIGWKGNSLGQIGLALALFLAVLLGVMLVRVVLLGRLRRLRRLAERTGVRMPLIVVEFLQGVPGLAWILLSMALAAQLLELPPRVHAVLGGLAVTVLVVLSVRLAQKVLEHLLYRHVPRLRTGDGQSLPAFFRITLGIVVWVLGLLLILSNLGINVNSLIAGMGVGGIAIALATQNILGDIFSSFSLYFDQPFREGDFITAGEHSGTVKKIGLKTTRLQALPGEEIVISNQELTTTRVQNFKKMRERTVQFRIAVALDTPPELLRTVPGLVKAAVEGKHEKLRFDRSSIREITQDGIEIDVLYTLSTDEFGVYVRAQEQILLELLARLRDAGVRLAVPVRRMENTASMSS